MLSFSAVSETYCSESQSTGNLCPFYSFEDHDPAGYTKLLAIIAGLPARAMVPDTGLLLPQVLPAVPTAAEAPVALLVDLGSGQVLHARNPDARFMPASVTKVMTLYLAFELIAQRRLDPAPPATTTRSDLFIKREL